MGRFLKDVSLVPHSAKMVDVKKESHQIQAVSHIIFWLIIHLCRLR
jgi:hypothetical protein